jgi:hypothetical protein
MAEVASVGSSTTPATGVSFLGPRLAFDRHWRRGAVKAIDISSIVTVM